MNLGLDLVKAIGPRAITPDVPEECRIVLGTDAAFKEAAATAARKRYVAMHARQQAIAQDLQQNEHKSVNGLGQHYMRIDAETYFQCRGLYGDDCWNDPEFVEAFHRDNPACRVKTTRGTRGQEIRK
jgi:hypothetical protein